MGARGVSGADPPAAASGRPARGAEGGGHPMSKDRLELGRRLFLALSAGALSVRGANLAEAASAPPLLSWNDGPAKKAIVDFVARVTTSAGPDYVAPAGRVAVFDNDGTLWPEQPIYFQFQFALDRVKALAPGHPEWSTRPPFDAVIRGDVKSLMASGETGILDIIAASHAGMTTDEFAGHVGDWLASARHPRFNRSYGDLVYQPMLELLGYLTDNGFKAFIVTGGGVEFMRVFAERVYGIPPERVVGSSGETKYEIRDGSPVLVKLAKVEFVNDGPGKPVGINRFIGRRPIFAFGNSDGDRQMLEWTMAGNGLHLAGLVHHTDAEREWSYDRVSPIGRLDKALDEAKTGGWTVVDMKADWRRVFAFQR